eukprot:347808-Chlamydomonas_euryale.AAC.1
MMSWPLSHVRDDHLSRSSALYFVARPAVLQPHRSMHRKPGALQLDGTIGVQDGLLPPVAFGTSQYGKVSENTMGMCNELRELGVSRDIQARSLQTRFL